MSVQVDQVQSHTFENKEENIKDIKQEKTLTFIPFGKYANIQFNELVKVTELKNGKIVETGKNYIRWLYSQTWLKENLKKSIEPYIK